MSLEKELDHSKMLLMQTSQADYENLCKLDVSGLQDRSKHNQHAVYVEFCEQLVQHPEGWYETGLLLKSSHAPLPSNKSGSLRRLTQRHNKLQRMGITKKYAEVIEQRKSEGIAKAATQPPIGRKFYIPHKLVMQTEADSTKLRIVYDALAHENMQAPSLNDCLYSGLSLKTACGMYL